MTIILSMATRDFVLQVGDRRVTLEQPGGSREISDPQSNKQAVLAAANGIAILGFTGTAFLDELPSDHVVAEAFAAIQMRYDEGRIGMRGIATIDDLPAGLGRVEAALNDGIREETARRLRNSQKPPRLIANAIGWLLGPEGARSFLWEYTSPPVPGEAGWRVASRVEAAALCVIPDPVNPKVDARLNKLATSLRKRNLDSRSAIDALSALVRFRSSLLPRGGVGPDAMSILVPRPIDALGIVIEYRPSGEPPLVSARDKSTGAVRVIGPGMYTPWIVGPSWAIPPQVRFGGAEEDAGGLAIRYVVPVMPSAGILHASGSMPERLRTDVEADLEDE